VFGPQKGATPDDVTALDAGLARFAGLLGGDPEAPGAGAAGGTGYGFAAVRASLQAAEQSVSDSRVSRTMARTAFRLAGALPPLKRKMFSGIGSEPEPAKV